MRSIHQKLTSILVARPEPSPRRSRGKRLGRVLAVALATIAGGVLIPAGPARAVDIDLVCTAAFQIDFSPALNGQSEANAVGANIAGTAVGCFSPNGSQPALTAAVLAGTPDAKAWGCAPLLLDIRGPGEITWNTGATSHLEFTISTNPGSGVGSLGLSAKITSGLLAGTTIAAIPVIVGLDGLCGLGGTRSLTANLAVAPFVH